MAVRVIAAVCVEVVVDVGMGMLMVVGMGVSVGVSHAVVGVLMGMGMLVAMGMVAAGNMIVMQMHSYRSFGRVFFIIPGIAGDVKQKHGAGITCPDEAYCTGLRLNSETAAVFSFMMKVALATLTRDLYLSLPGLLLEYFQSVSMV